MILSSPLRSHLSTSDFVVFRFFTSPINHYVYVRSGFERSWPYFITIPIFIVDTSFPRIIWFLNLFTMSSTFSLLCLISICSDGRRFVTSSDDQTCRVFLLEQGSSGSGQWSAFRATVIILAFGDNWWIN